MKTTTQSPARTAAHSGSETAAAGTEQLELFGRRRVRTWFAAGASAAGASAIGAGREFGTFHRTSSARLASPSQQMGPSQRKARVARQVSSSLFTFRGLGAPVERLVESAAPEAAQAAGRAASFVGADLHRVKKLRRRTLKHTAPKRVKIVRATALASRVALTAAPMKAQRLPLSRSTAPWGSAAVSYVFVVVTLACTFLV